MNMKREILEVIRALEHPGPVPIRGSVVDESKETVRVETGSSSFEIPKCSILSRREVTEGAAAGSSEFGIAGNAMLIQRVGSGTMPGIGGLVINDPVCRCACACACACNCACNCACACDCSIREFLAFSKTPRFRTRME
jgi:RNase P/RNase MRP subunit p29